MMDSWHTSIQNGCGNSVDLRKSYGGRFLNGFLKRVFYVIQRVARGDCRFLKEHDRYRRRLAKVTTNSTVLDHELQSLKTKERRVS